MTSEREVTEIAKSLLQPLSNKEIQNQLRVRSIPSRVEKYDVLFHVPNLESLFDINCQVLVLLYHTQEDFGHWVCIIDHSHRMGTPYYEFFDSYGLQPDDEFDFLPKIPGTASNRLTVLLSDAADRGAKIEYNHYRFQSFDHPIIATCGKWVLARALFYQKKLSEFAKLFLSKNNLERDIIISLFYSNLNQLPSVL